MVARAELHTRGQPNTRLTGRKEVTPTVAAPQEPIRQTDDDQPAASDADEQATGE